MTLNGALEMAVRTDPGLVRQYNEDAVHADAANGLAILADGMGGYNAGEVASVMAVSHLAANLGPLAQAMAAGKHQGREDEAALASHVVSEVAAANAAILETSQREAACAGMGTTLVLAWFCNNRMIVAHVGDSRLYRWREGYLQQLTHDHSLLQEQLDNGMITAEEARHSNERGFVTRALGVMPWVDVEVHDHDVLPGDVVLLCSDGLSDMLDDERIADILQANPEPAAAADMLVTQANMAGGRDNISVILVRVRGDFAQPSGWWSRLVARVR